VGREDLMREDLRPGIAELPSLVSSEKAGRLHLISKRQGSSHSPRAVRSNGVSTLSISEKWRILFSERYGGGMKREGLNSSLAWSPRTFTTRPMP